MEKATSKASGYDFFLLMGQINHFTQLVRRRELNHYHIAPQQLYVLRIIQELGAKATIAEVAKRADRKINAVCRQSIGMEKDGLIKRIKDTPKSRLLKMELTEKGLGMLKISKESKTINELFSVFTEEELQQIYGGMTKVYLKLKEGTDNGFGN
jgi:DNA-binding MarR family transcriptional regulator